MLVNLSLCVTNKVVQIFKMVKMNKNLLLVLIVTFLGACSSNQEDNTNTKEKAMPVKTVQVKKEKVEIKLGYSGTIEAFQTIPLTFQSSGTVEKVLVDIGDKVEKGQLLATVDESNARNMHQIATAKYQQAKDAYDRLKLVYDKGSLTEIKWVEMETNLEQAKSSLEISKSNLEKCKLYSPVNGLVGQRNIEPGMSSLSLMSAPLEIVDIKKIYVKISVPENEISKFKKGQKAEFTVSALNGGIYTGTVSHISPVADKISRTYEVKILASNSNENIKPGMVCDVKMEETVLKEAVLVPYQSVMKSDANETYVYLIDKSNNRVQKQNIIVGQYNGANLEVVSGLSEGQIVVSEGKERLSENTLIEM